MSEKKGVGMSNVLSWLTAILFGAVCGVGSAVQGAPESRPEAGGAEASAGIPDEPNAFLFGARIPRTMTLLATSNASRRNPVRILCYGQSVVAQRYVSNALDNELKQRYPFAEITVENRAIGGYMAPVLVRTAVNDLYPFYPDLVVFHVYGGYDTGELERIVSNIRKYTTAEILMWTHHYSNFGEGGTGHLQTESDGSGFRRYLAQKYNCELVELREAWQRYLECHKLTYQDMLVDGIHLNKRGGALQAALVLRHFRFNTLFPSEWMNTVRTYEARRPLEERNDEITFMGEPWRHSGAGVAGERPDSALRLAFHGNRVDVIASRVGARRGTARVLIDGRPPSAFPQAYAVTRPNRNPLSGRPMINRIEVGDRPVDEEWTLRVRDITPDGRKFRFALTGSVTGPDGEGTHGEPFTSASGRLRFQPAEFTFAGAVSQCKKPFTNEVTVVFKTVLMGTDVYAPASNAVAGAIQATTLIQGLDNRPHVLELIPNGDGPVPVFELVAHRPPLE